MNLFNTWFYQNVLNTEWLVWGIIITTLGFNILSPIFLWYSLTETKFQFRPVRFIKKITGQEKSKGS
ncbi:hypothetical protein [Halalkalibacter urbisdiaboli]|uniref:hypothetical protein n=1 Tax=Halalkalibacter urbisdiaboli TaxID=1960589 RepID=UPI000B445091|nr:hypothetical protein [Halalkalibacter urbisdiaboli]